MRYILAPLQFLAFAIFLLSGASYAQISAEFDSTKLLLDLKEFSSDSMAGRGVGQPGGEMARTFVEERFQQLELLQFNDDYRQDFAFAFPLKKTKVGGQNIIGWIEGSKYPDQYIVLSSHHDHLGTQNGEIFNGADDNGSGTCALFAMAEHYQKNPPLHSIIFVAFDAEENGLIGSKHFVNEPPVSLKKILFNLNMDMVSRNEKQEIFICGTHHYPKLKPALNHVDSLSRLTVSYGHDSGAERVDDWTHASDHGPFHKKKIPFVYLGVEDHEDYHLSTDDFERIDPGFYTEAVKVAIEICSSVDRIEKLKAIR